MNDNIKAGAEIHAGAGGYSIGTQEKYDEFVQNRNRGMNERIKELWNQSKNSGVHPEFGEYDKYSADKFAQLIVRECLSNMEDCDGDLDFAIWKTKTEFGVKEWLNW